MSRRLASASAICLWAIAVAAYPQTHHRTSTGPARSVRLTAGVAGTPSAGVYAFYQIVQTPDYVVFFMEAVHEARIIPLDGRAHLPSSMRTWDGDSRGRWDGDTLVVDTTNFRPEVNFLGAGAQRHLIERFWLAGPNELRYEVRVDDATTWTRPWTAMVRLTRTSERLYEFACHEGNAPSLEGILAPVKGK